MKERIEVSTVLPTTSQRLYTDWLSDEGHSEMTGGAAEAQPVVGSAHSAWDDYITGKQLELTPSTYIKQTWRSTEFDEKDADSVLEIQLEDTTEGCKVTLLHSEIPEGQGKRYAAGWEEHYFEPMRTYYSS